MYLSILDPTVLVEFLRFPKPPFFLIVLIFFHCYVIFFWLANNVILFPLCCHSWTMEAVNKLIFFNLRGLVFPVNTPWKCSAFFMLEIHKGPVSWLSRMARAHYMCWVSPISKILPYGPINQSSPNITVYLIFGCFPQKYFIVMLSFSQPSRDRL